MIIIKKVINCLFKNSIRIIIEVIIISTFVVSASTIINSSDVNYNNNSTNLNSTNVQDAIDEIYVKASDSDSCPENYDCINNYKFKINFGENISKVYYSLDNGTTYNQVTKSTIIYLDNGASVRAYAEGVGIKESKYNSPTNYWSEKVNGTDISYSPVGKEYTYYVSDKGTCDIEQSCNNKTCVGKKKVQTTAASCGGSSAYDNFWYSDGEYIHNIYSCRCALNADQTGCGTDHKGAPWTYCSLAQAYSDPWDSVSHSSTAGCVFTPASYGESADCSCTCSRVED